MLQSFITLLTPVFISLTTLAGVALHETKLDKLALTTMAIPVTASITTPSVRTMTGDPHTHVERVSVNSEVRSASPMLAPRYGEQKRHLMQKGVPRGYHRFDHYSLLFS